MPIRYGVHVRCLRTGAYRMTCMRHTLKCIASKVLRPLKLGDTTTDIEDTMRNTIDAVKQQALFDARKVVEMTIYGEEDVTTEELGTQIVALAKTFETYLSEDA